MGRLLRVTLTTIATCVTALSMLAGPASATTDSTPLATWPPPTAGNVYGSIWHGSVDCVWQSGIEICDATVYTSGLMNGWATSNQYQRKLNLEWKIRNNDGVVVKTGSAYCQGATSAISSCQRSGPSWGVRWPKNYSYRVCVDTIGYAYYYVSTNGDIAKVSRSDYDCITMGSGYPDTTPQP